MSASEGMRDGCGVPIAVIETVELTQRRFGEVDAAFAFDEGEGDRTLASWRLAHQNYFRRQGTFAPDMPLFCERFRLATRIDAAALPARPGLRPAISAELGANDR
jgi:uncharacterized protein YhfF